MTLAAHAVAAFLLLTDNPYCWMLNFGWLLDDPSQEKALFMCSPRLAVVHLLGEKHA